MTRRKSRKKLVVSREPEQSFHITVGATFQWEGKLDLTHELRLLKAALLYADRVKLCSLTSSMIVTLSQIQNLTRDEKIELAASNLKTYVELSNESNTDDLAKYIDFAKELQLNRRLKKELKKTLSHKEQLLVHQFDKHFRKTVDELDKAWWKATTQLTDEASAAELAAILNSGLVELHWFEPTHENIGKEFFNVISDAVISNKTYPLFDDATGKLVNAGIREQKLTLPDMSVSRAKQVGLAANLLNRLPLFDYASVDEIIDIRNELDKPLVRFRSAIIEFSDEIHNASWEEGFSEEAEQTFYQKVEPTIQDIEEAFRSNKQLMTYLKKFLDKDSVIAGGAVGSILGVLLARTDALPETISLLSAAAGVTSVLIQAEQEWREKNEEIKRNQLYFYYHLYSQ